MSTTDYPDTYKPATHGSFKGRITELRRVTVKDVATDEPVDKVVADIEVTESKKVAAGEHLSVFLEGALLSKFENEAKNRARVGKSGFEPNEEITVEYLGKKKSASSGFSYHNYTVEFEHGVPDTGAFDLLSGVAGINTPDPAPLTDMPTSPVGDSEIPF